MKTPHLWVPLEILILDGQQVNADLYLLTDMPVNTSDLNVKIGQSAVGSQVPGVPGLRVAFQEKMTPLLYHDLSTDRNMSWVRSDSWLTYLSLDAPDSAVTYDMGISGFAQKPHLNGDFLCKRGFCTKSRFYPKFIRGLYHHAKLPLCF